VDVDAGLDFYNRYPTDIALMKQLGLKHLRLSLSWSRLLPKGGKGAPVNPEGVAFYSKVLYSLAAAGIEPMGEAGHRHVRVGVSQPKATCSNELKSWCCHQPTTSPVVLYHWDLPQVLQSEYGGFLSPRIVDDFAYYADTAFRLFGSRVKRWITFIEPAVVCNQGYGNGQHKPGVQGGDAGRYKCGHNLLLAHAAAVQLYRTKYARTQGGQLSFTTLVTWAEPASSSEADKRAAQNKLDADVGWMLDAVFFGDWPGERVLGGRRSTA
jgi:beta-glucosidase/6-phospho-beta-glucosidase/beta-galactosidase